MFDIMDNKNEPEHKITHIIEVFPGTTPIKQKTRGIPQAFKEEFRKTIDEMKASGMIIDSNSPWCSPIRLVRKPDNSIRVTVDFRKLNNVTRKDSFPIPKISEIMDQLVKAKYFTSIDLGSAYHQIKMDKDSQQYTAFATQWGFYEYTVMAMGLTNACATFQRCMSKVLDGFLDKFALVYLDDILIYSENEEDHKRHVKMVVDRLRRNNLKIKLSKCKFAKTKIEYLSHVIENGTISPNPAKIAAVKNIKPPRNVKQLQSFIGFCSYYRKYVKNFSSIVSPLLKLTEKRVEFIWTELHQNAFDQLKSYLISTDHVLALPDFDKPFRIECDASKIGISGVISQKHGCHYKPIAFYSKHLSKTERAYSTSERELLGIVLSVEHFKQYIYGRHVEIWTDHEPLKFLSTADVPSPRLARLQKRLNIYNYSIQYRPGKANGNADALSRLVEEDENEIDDHETDA